MNALIVILIWLVVASLIAWMLGKAIQWGTEISPSEQAEQDKEDLLARENAEQYGGFYYSGRKTK